MLKFVIILVLIVCLLELSFYPRNKIMKNKNKHSPAPKDMRNLEMKKGPAMEFEARIKAIDRYVQEWMAENGEVEARPFDVADYLVEKGVYKDYDDQDKKGRSLRADLIKIKEKGRVNELRGLQVVERANSIGWVFKRIKP